jgi:uncharacterized protein (DUF849 family)
MSGGGDDDTKITDTPEQRYMAQIAAEKWNFAQDNLAPLEDLYMKRVDDLDSASRNSYLRGVTNQANQASLGNNTQKVTQQLGQAGINPNSGRFIGTQTQLADQSASNGGETMGRAQFQQQIEKTKGLQNVIALGAGKETMATNGLGDIANASSKDAMADSRQAFSRNQSNLQLLGTLAGGATRVGLAAAGNGWLGETAQNAYNNSKLGAGLNLGGN